jgi:archaellum component FlaC
VTIEARLDKITDSMEAIQVSMVAIKNGLETMKERHDALAMNLELVGHGIHDLKIASQQDGENIRALARIAEMHERRISDIEN